MSKMYEAVVRVQVPTGGKSWNGSLYQTESIGQTVVMTVPDTGGYYATKSLLEAQYGAGSVQRLSEKNG